MVMTSDLYKAFSGYKYKDSECRILYPDKIKKSRKKGGEKSNRQ